MLGKKLLIGTIAAGFLTCAMAQNNTAYQAPPAPFTPNLYLGAKIGYSTSGWNAVDHGIDKISADTGFAAGIFGGWQFLRNFALEAAWTPTLYATKFEEGTNTFKANSQGTLELVGKMLVPMPNVDGVDIYAKLGGAYMYVNKAPSFRSDGVTDHAVSMFSLAYGAGVTWTVMPNIGLDLGWTQYNGNKNIGKDYIPARNDFMLGGYYTFPLA